MHLLHLTQCDRPRELADRHHLEQQVHTRCIALFQPLLITHTQDFKAMALAPAGSDLSWKADRKPVAIAR
jgi:hypothetical protein